MLFAHELSPAFVRTVAFLFGAAWGSFFNVAIYRWPLEMSVVSPPSHCPGCGAKVRAWHNVPVLGYIFLRGKAACCGTKLSPRYLLVEVLAAVLCLALAEQYIVRADADVSLLHAALETLVYFLFAGGLLVATFVDLDCMQIPDEVSLPGAALGLVTASWRSFPGPAAAALGAGLGFLLVQMVFVWGYERLTGRRGMGEGDSKLLMMIGAFLGYKGVVFALFAGSAQGLIAAGVLLATGRRLSPPGVHHDEEEPGTGAEALPNSVQSPIGSEQAPTAEDNSAQDRPSRQPVGRLKMPFGPFLALAAIEFLFFGPALVDRYFALFR